MCTNLLLTVPASPGNATNAVHVSARALELSSQMSSSLYLVPRGQSFPLVLPKKIDAPLKWTNAYGFVGVASPSSFATTPCFMEGLNEKGLSAAALWLPGTGYPASGPNRQVYFADLGAWILGNYASVVQLESDLRQGTAISVVGPPAEEGTGYVPFHFIATDATGASVVIEFIDGTMNVYGADGGPNGVPAGATGDGVLTNAPTYDWQRANLQSYQTLDIVGPATSLLTTTGPLVGSGLLGMPGDPMSASRFVRAATLRQGFDPSCNLLPADGTGWLPAPGGSTPPPPAPPGFAGPVQTVVNVAMQLVQMVTATPYGTTLAPWAAAPPPARAQVGDWTMWCVVRDHTNTVFYFTTAFNGIMRGITLSAELFDPTGAPTFPGFHSIALLPSPQLAWYEPVTFG